MAKPTCKVDGCETTSVKRGLCKLHYGRFLAAGTLEQHANPTILRTETFHRLSGVDLEARTATCSVCGPLVPIRPKTVHHGSQCMTKVKEARAKERRRPRTLARWHQRKYGLSAAQYAALLARAAGKCELCGTELDGDERIDHCHETGLVRGILCNRCNLGLGWFEDDPVRLLAAHLYVKAGGKMGEAS